MINQDTTLNTALLEKGESLSPEELSRSSKPQETARRPRDNYQVGRALAQPRVAAGSSDLAISSDGTAAVAPSSLLDHVSAAFVGVVESITGAGSALGQQVRNFVLDSKQGDLMRKILSFLPTLINISSVTQYFAAFDGFRRGNPLDSVGSLAKGFLLNLGAGEVKKLVNSSDEKQTKSAISQLFIQAAGIGALELGQQYHRGKGRGSKNTPVRLQKGIDGILTNMFRPIQNILSTTFLGRRRYENHKLKFNSN
ncbi:MAG: hypothetical protein HRT47_09710 [Candidatus Caenarcaniphilales bacterium]|nr:hypothetical protein [Candidatus Caenarcaniphilales bacterium]